MQACLTETVINLFEKQVKKAPENIAIRFGEQNFTYQALNEKANQLAHYLRECGIGREAIVAICLERGIDMVVAIVGILKAGAAYLPLDSIYPTDYLADIISDAKPAMLITQKILKDDLSFSSLLGNQDNIYCLDSNENKLDTFSCENPASINEPNDLMYVIYTSGTTGKPKGVMLENRAIVHLFNSAEEILDFDSSDRWTLFHSYSFDFFIWELWGALLHGAMGIIVPAQVARDASLFWQFLYDQKVSILNQTPSAFYQLEQVDFSKKIKLNLRYLLLGGEKLLAHQVQSWMNKYGDNQPILVNLYGATETAICATYHRIRQNDIHDDLTGFPIGKPLPDISYYILDEKEQLVSDNSTGELYVGGVGLARGYLNQSELTNQYFVSNRYTLDEALDFKKNCRLYRTGDLVSRLDSGALTYIGRVDNQVKIRGFRVELSYIERCLLEYSYTDQCVVLAKTNPNDSTKYLVAYLSSVKTQNIDMARLQSYLEHKLPRYMIPTQFVQVAQFPVTVNGKIDRRALSELKLSKLLTSSKYVAPKSEQMYKLCELWEASLNRSQVGIRDNFFLLGGDSLVAAKIALSIEKAIGIVCEVHDVLLYPTVETLSGHLQTKKVKIEKLTLPVLGDSEDSPLSFAQQRLWFAHQELMDQAPEAYNVKFALHFSGNLDKALMKNVLQKLINRHNNLRTYFPSAEKYSVATVELDLDYECLPVNETNSKQVVQSMIDKLGKHHFGDLSQAPLFRFVLIEIDANQFVLSMVFHHIIIDGFSIPVFVKELAALYNGQACEPLNMQYGDYARWEQARFKQGHYDLRFDYWKKQLSGATGMLNLPTDKIRPEKPTYQAKSHFFYFPAGLVNQLQELASQQSVTLFTLLLTSIANLLYRYTQQSDFNIGVICGERSCPDLRSLIGFFVSALPIRFEQEGDMSFLDVLQQSNKTLLDAYANNAPLEKIQHQMELPHHANTHPLFQVLMTMHNLPDLGMNFDGLDVSTWDESLISASDMNVAKFELRFEMELIDDGRLAAKIEYATDLFNAESIERMACYWYRLSEAIVKQPKASISRFSLLTETEKNGLVKEWAQQAPLYPTSNLLAVFEEQVQACPNAVAVVDGESTLTYQALDRKVNQLANYFLHSLRVSSGSENIIAIMMERSANFVVSVLAILKTGSAYLPLDPDLPNLRLKLMLEDANSIAIVTKTSLVSKFNGMGINCVCLDDSQVRTEILAESIEQPKQFSLGSDLAVVLYTSGSTGRPKGVMIEHNNILQLVKNTNYVQISREDRIVQGSTPVFDAYLFEVFGALLNGASLFVCPKAVLLDINQFRTFLTKNKMTILFLTPALFYRFISSEPVIFKSLNYVIFSGEKLASPNVVNYLIKHPLSRPTHLIHAYGPTENTTFSTYYEINSNTPTDRELPIGRPIQTTTGYILDQQGQPVPAGMIGELCVGGSALARGYLNQPTLTQERFVNSSISRSLLYRTGDCVYYRDDGSIVFVGRGDKQIKLSGYRIELKEVEIALLSQSVIKEAIVTKQVSESNQWIVAYIVPAISVKDSRQFKWEVHAKLAELLPHYMLPSAFMLISALPLTLNGKLDYRQLPKPDFDTCEQYVAPKTAIEQQLMLLWIKVLSVKEKISITDNFFAVGGTSLLAMELVHHISQKFDKISYSTLLSNPTIKEQAKLIEMDNKHEQQNTTLDMDYFREQAKLDEDIVLPDSSPYYHVTNPKAIFLTGVTGFLGIFLLEELIRTTSATIYCLIRANNSECAKERLDKTLTKYQLSGIQPYLHRVKLVVGDITKPLLDIPHSLYKTLTENIEVIYHCASDVNFVKPYSALKASNVTGTRNILRFAVTNKVKLVHHVSTAAVFSFRNVFLNESLLKEEDVIWDEHMAKALPYDLGYTQSKAVAEKLVWQAKCRHIPVAIYRPGFILCHSETGVGNTNQLWARFSKDCIALGSFPAFTDLKEEFVTVDYAARAIAHISRQADCIGRVFHIVPSAEGNLTTDAFFSLIRYNDNLLKKEPLELWRKRWLDYIENNSASALKLLLPLFTESIKDDLILFEVYQGSPHFDKLNTLMSLENSQIPEINITLNLMTRYLGYILMANGSLQVNKSKNGVFTDVA